jgi:hypothetical protein
LVAMTHPIATVPPRAWLASTFAIMAIAAALR